MKAGNVTKIVETAWIFDVDGVITNPSLKKITNLKILELIKAKLDKGDVVVFATGRSLVWVIDRVLDPLLLKINDKNVLENFFVVGEKGGTWLKFGNKGTIKQYKEDSVVVPTSLQKEIKVLVKNRYSDSVFFDSSKETMISVEMKDGYSVKDYTEEQKLQMTDLQNILERGGYDKTLKIDPSTIALDIINKDVGKGFSIERILKWLEEKEIEVNKFIVFGDSPADLEMAEKLFVKNMPVEMVFVGEKEKLEEKNYHFPLVFTKEKFEKGTLEYFRKKYQYTLEVV